LPRVTLFEAVTDCHEQIRDGMPVDEADLGLDWQFGTKNLFLFAAFVFAALFIFSIKQLYGTYNPVKVFREYSMHKKNADRYNRLFETRENICYHIGWARSRGSATDEIRTLVNDLKAVDAEIDEMETKTFRRSKQKSDC